MSRPRGNGYEALPAHDELDEEHDAVNPQDGTARDAHWSSQSGNGTSAPRRGNRSRSLSSLSIDAGALDVKLTQWRRAIKRKFAKKQCE